MIQQEGGMEKGRVQMRGEERKRKNKKEPIQKTECSTAQTDAASHSVDSAIDRALRPYLFWLSLCVRDVHQSRK